MLKSFHTLTVAPDPLSLPHSTSIDRSAGVVDSASPAAADVSNLFARFGSGESVLRYREIHADAEAEAATARWPLLAEWLATTLPGEPRR